MAAVLTEATSEASLQQRRENGAPLLKQLRECVGEARRRQEERNVLIVARGGAGSAGGRHRPLRGAVSTRRVPHHRG